MRTKTRKNSVKDLIVIEEPDKNRTGTGIFFFSDRYSLFDWGEMPDQIQAKGAALCITTAYFFEKLEEMGIPTHYLGLVEEEEGEGEVGVGVGVEVGVDVKSNSKRLSELKSAQSQLKIKLLRVLTPEINGNTYDYGYNYSVYREEKEMANFLIPLEVIYRNSLPDGSSVFARLKERDGSLRLRDLGLTEFPYPGQVLKEPFLDVSTKFERSDRYLSWEEAKRIAGLSDDEVEEIKRITLLINELITREAGKIGLVNEDGKVEFGFDDNRNLMVVDAFGTLDESRFTYNGLPVSKEIARIFYRKTSWYEAVEEAKKVDKIGWKKLVKNKPPSLPTAFKDSISILYKASCNEITEKIWFAEVKSLKAILEEIKEILAEQTKEQTNTNLNFESF